MMITFADAPDQIPAPGRTQIERVLIEAIAAAKPGYEHWIVKTRNLVEGRIRFYEFALGVEAVRWLTLTDVDDAAYTVFFGRRSTRTGRH
jgi:hypothetical protein